VWLGPSSPTSRAAALPKRLPVVLHRGILASAVIRRIRLSVDLARTPIAWNEHVVRQGKRSPESRVDEGSGDGDVLAIHRRVVDRLVEILDGLTEAELNWHPPAPETNSLFVLATHTIANTEDNILATLCGEPLRRERAAEFQAYGTTFEPLRQRWAFLRRRIEAALADLPPSALDGMRQHPRRGPVTAREILLVVARHAAEHLGQAELTRDLMRAAKGEKSR
jgi:DinB family protein